MTVGCMEMCNRDPCVDSMGMRTTLQAAQERILSHLRHLRQLAVCAQRPGKPKRRTTDVEAELFRDRGGTSQDNAAK